MLKLVEKFSGSGREIVTDNFFTTHELAVLPQQHNKPELIIDYNFGKKDVDQFDENIEEFTYRRKTVRRPLLIFYNMLDVAAFDGYLLMKMDRHRDSRKVYLKNLAR